MRAASWESVLAEVLARAMCGLQVLRRLWSPSEDVALAPHVGAAAQRAALRIDADGNHAGAHPVRLENFQFVATRNERLAHRVGHAPLDFEEPRLAPVIVERAERMKRVDPRLFNRLLDIEVEHEDLEQHVQDLLILTVAARGAQGEEWLGVLQH